MTRLLASVLVGLSLAGIALAACSSLDPGPPNPHFTSGDPLSAVPPDASDAAPEGAP